MSRAFLSISGCGNKLRAFRKSRALSMQLDSCLTELLRREYHVSSPSIFRLEKLMSVDPTKVTINDLCEMAQSKNTDMLLKNAEFIHNELPVRLAHRIIDMKCLPYYVVSTSPIKEVLDVYQDSFSTIANFPPVRTTDDDLKFTEMLKGLIEKSKNIVELLATGLKEAQHRATMANLSLSLDAYLDKTLSSRIGTRVLIEHHILLHAEQPVNFRGVINMESSPMKLFSKALGQSSAICSQRYGAHPRVHIKGTNRSLPYIDFHMEYIFREILKNAMLAVIENYKIRNPGALILSDNVPPIEILMVEGSEEITIRVSDRGGGIPKENENLIFNYGYSTADTSNDQHNQSLGDLLTQRDEQQTPMAGLGFGLPLSRLYAEYFAGGLQLVNLEGHGTDVYIRLNHTGDMLENVKL